MAEQDEFAVEAGDASALQLLRRPRAVRARAAHQHLQPRGAGRARARWARRAGCAPVELSLDARGARSTRRTTGAHAAGRPIATEVFAFGRLPLAFSARCFTARHHRLQQGRVRASAACDDADGLLLSDAARASPSWCSTARRRNRPRVQCLIGERRGAARGGRVARCGCRRARSGFAQVLRRLRRGDEPARRRARPRCRRWPASACPAAWSTATRTRRPGMRMEPRMNAAIMTACRRAAALLRRRSRAAPPRRAPAGRSRRRSLLARLLDRVLLPRLPSRCARGAGGPHASRSRVTDLGLRVRLQLGAERLRVAPRSGEPALRIVAPRRRATGACCAATTTPTACSSSARW